MGPACRRSVTAAVDRGKRRRARTCSGDPITVDDEHLYALQRPGILTAYALPGDEAAVRAMSLPVRRTRRLLGLMALWGALMLAVRRRRAPRR